MIHFLMAIAWKLALVLSAAQVRKNVRWNVYLLMKKRLANGRS